MIVGFTGTQNGMNDAQKDAVKNYLREYRPSEAHHGDCIGSDKEFHDICEGLFISVVIHPPDNVTKRAYCESDTILITKPYLERNKRIVEACDVLIATPKGEEVVRSGTWSTIRYARQIGKIIYLCYP